MQIECQTNVGQKRKNNQDTVGVYHNEKGIPLAIVADGMGGHQAGDTASQLMVTGIGSSWENCQLDTARDIEEWIVKNIQQQNDVIFQEGQAHPEKFGMGTTIVATVILDNQLLLAHVGDSRGYLAKAGVIKQLTEDHSLVNELVKTGEITPEMALKHPKRNILIRSVGVEGTIAVDLTWVTIQSDSYLLLCSDGLTNMVSDELIRQIIVGPGTLQNKVTELITEANNAGGVDNITALLVYFETSGKEDKE